MPTTRNMLQLFVASPSDVAEERDALEDVVKETNRIWRHKAELNLELLRWEDDTFPGFSTDAQDVVNAQIGDAYDVFVGIFWCRFGSPTSRFASGTLEEFERAYARRSAGENIDILIYFKDAPIPPSQLDVEQFTQVLEFKKLIKKRGGLHKHFINIDDFKKQVMFALHRIMENHAHTVGEAIKAGPGTEVAEDDEAGFLDYVEGAVVCIEKIGAEAIGINNTVATWSERIPQVTEAINAGLKAQNLPIIVAERTRAAGIFDEFTNDLRAGRKRMRKEFEQATDFTLKAVGLASEFEPMPQDVKDTTLKGFVEMTDALRFVSQSVEQFKAPLETMPRVSKKLNKSVRRCVEELRVLLAEFVIMQDMCNEVVANVKRLPAH